MVFDFAALFDENTVKVKEQYVDVAYIVRKREEQQKESNERRAETAKREESKRQIEAAAAAATEAKPTENETKPTEGNVEMAEGMKRSAEKGDGKEVENGSEEPPPSKRSKRKEGKRGQNKKRGQHFEGKIQDKVKPFSF